MSDVEYLTEESLGRTGRQRILKALAMLCDAYLATGVPDYMKYGAPMTKRDLETTRKNIVRAMEIIRQETGTGSLISASLEEAGLARGETDVG